MTMLAEAIDKIRGAIICSRLNTVKTTIPL